MQIACIMQEEKVKAKHEKNQKDFRVEKGKQSEETDGRCEKRNNVYNCMGDAELLNGKHNDGRIWGGDSDIFVNNSKQAVLIMSQAVLLSCQLRRSFIIFL